MEVLGKVQILILAPSATHLKPTTLYLAQRGRLSPSENSASATNRTRSTWPDVCSIVWRSHMDRELDSRLAPCSPLLSLSGILSLSLSFSEGDK